MKMTLKVDGLMRKMKQLVLTPYLEVDKLRVLFPDNLHQLVFVQGFQIFGLQHFL
jgi:hypothetical protein